MQPSGADVFGQQLGKPNLVEGRCARVEGSALVRIEIDTDHFMAELRHRNSVGSTQVTASDHGDPHGLLPISVLAMLKACEGM